MSEPSKILYAATLTGPTQINGQPGEEVSIRFTLLNSGPTKDTYTLNVSDLSGWTFSPVTASVDVSELDSVDMGVTVTLPSTLGAENIVTVVATSQADPSVKAMAQTYVLVATEEMLKNFTVSEDSLLMRLNQELPADTETTTPVVDDNTVEDEPVTSPPSDDTLSSTVDDPDQEIDIFTQAQESDIFTSVEATLEWLEANNLSPEDLTEEQLDALPITWNEPLPVEPPIPPEPDDLTLEPDLTTVNELDEMEQLLVSINRKEVMEQAEVDRLNELSEVLLVIAETITQNYQAATQAALDQERIEPLTQFESQIKPLQNKLTAIAMLGQNAMDRLQVGEMLLSQELVNSIPDEELAAILGKQGLKAHSEAGIISATRSQAISELEIPALELDILDVLDSDGNSCSVNSTTTPISHLDSVLDILFPKAQAAAVLSCVAICASQGFGPRCVACIVSKGVSVTRTLINLIGQWKRCSGCRKWWCRTKIVLKIIYYVG